jgi:hypothetical protein
MPMKNVEVQILPSENVLTAKPLEEEEIYVVQECMPFSGSPF